LGIDPFPQDFDPAFVHRQHLSAGSPGDHRPHGQVLQQRGQGPALLLRPGLCRRQITGSFFDFLLHPRFLLPELFLQFPGVFQQIQHRRLRFGQRNILPPHLLHDLLQLHLAILPPRDFLGQRRALIKNDPFRLFSQAMVEIDKRHDHGVTDRNLQYLPGGEQESGHTEEAEPGQGPGDQGIRPRPNHPLLSSEEKCQERENVPPKHGGPTAGWRKRVVEKHNCREDQEKGTYAGGCLLGSEEHQERAERDQHHQIHKDICGAALQPVQHQKEARGRDRNQRKIRQESPPKRFRQITLEQFFIRFVHAFRRAFS